MSGTGRDQWSAVKRPLERYGSVFAKRHKDSLYFAGSDIGSLFAGVAAKEAVGSENGVFSQPRVLAPAGQSDPLYQRHMRNRQGGQPDKDQLDEPRFQRYVAPKQ